ncbi:glycosyltransferase family 2 protein [Adlercreutzia sp. ZJ154]|uniref:glycosyltransferase family 2 protein n=1 Tax=Adlercreutzia sp. ZJ154 TaxID=2709790 RepID=UPI0013EC164F|nr:glycosyltransferase family 2 protein [Adlercreutzia sp. ZJ154]
MISVVIVTYNTESMLVATLESVLRQTSDKFDVICIDGGSKDGTVALLESANNKLTERGIPCFLSSEPDKGIYDAMNKGICQATQPWIYFLNAGDRFWSDTTLETICVYLSLSEADIVYGDIGLKSLGVVEGEVGILSAHPVSLIEERMPFCHQAAFVKTSVMREYRFDCTHPFAADYELFLRAYQDGKVFAHVDLPIAIYDEGGVSSTRFVEVAKDYRRVQRLHSVERSQGVIGGVRYAKELLMASYQELKSGFKRKTY